VVFIQKIKNGTIEETNIAVKKRLGSIPIEFRKTLTRDRGSENMGHQELEKELDIKCFFAHAYSSWERGSNENTNGLIRRYFPKKTDFKMITEKEIKRVEYLLNSRPRKRLG
jgi:IS30 family transposase